MRTSVLASLAVLVGATTPPDYMGLFKDFMKKYDRHYSSEFEKGKRFQIFRENIDKIYASNSQKKSYTLGITAHTDRTFEEWRSEHVGGFKASEMLTASRDNVLFTAPQDFKEPDSIDWTTKGAVTSVKNQGTCGSCWAFSAAGALEGALAVAGRPLVDLSEQRIIACDKGGNGCGGGNPMQAFEWVSENGIDSLKDDPYLCTDGTSSQCKSMTCSAGGACTNRTGETCIFGGCTQVAGSICNHHAGLINKCECPEAGQCFSNGKCGGAPKPPAMVLAPGDVTTFKRVDQTENALEAAVAQQPVSVAIEADQSVYQHYTSGVLTSDACGGNLDHGVLIVGYGVEDGKKYWKVKNSWGSSWGDEGFIKIEKGKAGDGGECGIRKMASFPVVKEASSLIV